MTQTAQTAKGSLTMVGLNTPAPKVFWNGELVPGIIAIRVDWELDEQRVRLRVNNTNQAVYAEMLLAGIIIKKV